MEDQSQNTDQSQIYENREERLERDHRCLCGIDSEERVGDILLQHFTFSFHPSLHFRYVAFPDTFSTSAQDCFYEERDDSAREVMSGISSSAGIFGRLY